MADHRPAVDTVRSPLGAVTDRSGRVVARARRHGGEAGRLRLRQLEITVVIAAQAGLAAALAALLAEYLLGPGAHVFAPAAAVGTIATAIGQRARRTFELLVGVGLGIVVGDVLLFLFGSGAWQTGVVVALAIATALLVAGRGGALVGQAGGTAVLIATLAPVQPGLELPRIFDALVGGVVGILVVVLLLPVNPQRVLDRAAAPIFAVLTDQLYEVARALTARDAEAAIRVLDRLRGLDADVGRLNEALSGAEEVVTLAPARWHRRTQYHRYARGAEHLERLILYARSLARRSATVLQYGEPVPAQLPAAVARLGDAVAELRRECRDGVDPEGTRRLTGESAELAGQAWAVGVRSFGDALVTDLRTADSELVRATGYEAEEANRMIRRAAGAGQAAIRPPLRAEMHRPSRPARPSRTPAAPTVARSRPSSGASAGPAESTTVKVARHRTSPAGYGRAMSIDTVPRRFASLTTAHVADACLRARVPVRCAPAAVRPVLPGTRLAGRVAPTRHVGSVDIFLEAIDRAAPGDVLVVDNAGRTDESCVGDLVVLEAQAAGLAGVVVWGLHRDTADIRAVGLPVFSIGAIPTGPQRLDARPPQALDSAVVGDWTVDADDLVLADDDGVLFVPAARAGELFTLAETIRDTERRQAERIRAGVPLRDQVGFGGYLAARAQDPSLTFRDHLRAVGGAIEE